MKLIIFLVGLAAAFVGGYLSQAYVLPRVGLAALDLGEYAVPFTVLTVAHLVVAIVKEVLDA